MDIAEDESVGCVQIVQCGVTIETQDEAVEETAGTQKYSAAPGGTPTDGDAVGFAGVEMDVVRTSAAGAENDGRGGPLPESQHLGATRLGLIEQRFIKREILGQARQRLFE